MSARNALVFCALERHARLVADCRFFYTFLPRKFGLLSSERPAAVYRLAPPSDFVVVWFYVVAGSVQIDSLQDRPDDKKEGATNLSLKFGFFSPSTFSQ